VHSIHFTYSEYLLLHFPVIGLVGTVALPVFIRVLFPDRIRPQRNDAETLPLSRDEKRLLVVLVAALGLWATDSVHGVSPAWVSLGAGIICVFPVIGVLAPDETIRMVNFSALLFLAGFIGMGAVVTHSGLGKELAGWLINALSLEPGGGLGDFAAIIGLGVVLQLVTTLPGQPAIMAAFADTLAQATALPLKTVLMSAVASWALVMFPYQAPPLVATRAISNLPVSAFIRLMLVFAAFGWAVMVPLQFYWWRFLGYLPVSP
jgi:di/tricarboxylate transporter